MRNLIWMGAATLTVLMGAVACNGDGIEDGMGGGGAATGGTSSGGVSTGGQSTGGSATGGVSQGGMGGGGMGGLGTGGAGTGGTTEPPTLEQACASRCATRATVTCAGSPDENACNASCVNGGEPGCEDEYYTYRACEADTETSHWQCVTAFSMVAPSLSNPCFDEDEAYWACYDNL